MCQIAMSTLQWIICLIGENSLFLSSCCSEEMLQTNVSSLHFNYKDLMVQYVIKDIKYWIVWEMFGHHEFSKKNMRWRTPTFIVEDHAD